ncbi:hypothetical protein EDB80DRAFT_882503 [Ilyonectria destructans]|nr:hypothetical protein EDB80DRAFT_882503 [Ilyonectria destructans]
MTREENERLWGENSEDEEKSKRDMSINEKNETIALLERRRLGGRFEEEAKAGVDRYKKEEMERIAREAKEAEERDKEYQRRPHDDLVRSRLTKEAIGVPLNKGSASRSSNTAADGTRDRNFESETVVPPSEDDHTPSIPRQTYYRCLSVKPSGRSGTSRLSC